MNSKAQTPKPSPYIVPEFMRVISAKFTCYCADTGRKMYRGESVYYDPAGRRVFCPSSDIVRIYNSKDEARQEARNVRAYVEAQENAYFDNFSRNL